MWWVSAIVMLAACGRIGFDQGGDARSDDAPSCTKPDAFYVDADGDGHGDASQTVLACSAPVGTVDNDDDCDDQDRYRYPGAMEVCDGQDNDCEANTGEICPVLCVPRRRPAPDDAHVYLFCGAAQTWANARASCMASGFDLAIVDDVVENGWLVQQGTAIHGSPQQWAGANDIAVEGTWQWTDGTVFWQGDATGAPVGGRYSSWEIQEPNNSDVMGENCLGIIANGDWNDLLCDPTTRDFACERN